MNAKDYIALLEYTLQELSAPDLPSFLPLTNEHRSPSRQTHLQLTEAQCATFNPNSILAAMTYNTLPYYFRRNPCLPGRSQASAYQFCLDGCHAGFTACLDSDGAELVVVLGIDFVWCVAKKQCLYRRHKHSSCPNLRFTYELPYLMQKSWRRGQKPPSFSCWFTIVPSYRLIIAPPSSCQAPLSLPAVPPGPGSCLLARPRRMQSDSRQACTELLVVRDATRDVVKRMEPFDRFRD